MREQPSSRMRCTSSVSSTSVMMKGKSAGVIVFLESPNSTTRRSTFLRFSSTSWMPSASRFFTSEALPLILPSA